MHKDYKLIEIRHTSHYYKYDPFVLAKQALQVYFAPYPSLKRDKADWSAVIKTKARFTFEGIAIPDDAAYQTDANQSDEIIIANDVNLESLNDESNELIEAFESTEDNDIEYETETESENEEEEFYLYDDSGIMIHEFCCELIWCVML